MGVEVVSVVPERQSSDFGLDRYEIWASLDRGGFDVRRERGDWPEAVRGVEEVAEEGQVVPEEVVEETGYSIETEDEDGNRITVPVTQEEAEALIEAEQVRDLFVSTFSRRQSSSRSMPAERWWH